MPRRNTPTIDQIATEALSQLTELESDDGLRTDGTLQNALLGFGDKNGIETDVEAYNSVGSSCRLTKQQQETLFAEDAMIERVCTFFPGEMARSGFTTGHPKDEKIQEWVEESELMGLFEEASVLANIYDRGAGIVLAVDDEQPEYAPVDVARIKSVSPLFVRGGHYLIPNWTSLNRPSMFTLSISGESVDQLLSETGMEKPKTAAKGIGSQIHPDRVLWFPGIWVPADVERTTGSPSLLSRFWKHYSRWEMANKIVLNLMARISVVHYQQKGWTKLLAQNDQNSVSEVRRRLEILKTMSTMGILVSDMDNNKVEIVSRTLTEVANIMDRLERGMLAASGMSRLDLMGIAEGGGLAADDLRDRLLNARKVLTEQNRYWKRPLSKVLRYFCQSIGSDETPKVTFNSTLIYTRKEQIDELQVLAGAIGGLTGLVLSTEEARSILNQSELLKDQIVGDLPQPEVPLEEEVPIDEFGEEAAAI